MGWLIALLVLILLSFLPLVVRVTYDAGGASAKLYLFGIPIVLYPRDARKTNAKTETQEKKGGSLQPGKMKRSEDKSTGDLEQFLRFLRVIAELLKDLGRKLRVRKLELRLVFAGEDPSDVALNYGRANAVIANVLPHLERLFVIKKRSVDVSCDFSAPKTRIYACIDISLTLGRAVRLAVRYGIRFLKEYSKMNKRKGGAEK